jgi:Protein of unknown function (DUF3574).
MAVYVKSEADTLYFGTARPDGSVVSDAEWKSFLADEVTARFPDGLTTWDADGQYRDSRGVIEHERTHLVQIVHHVNAADEGKIAAIISVYRKRFQQESVLLVRSDVWLPR